jgi:hypothetical protein
MGKVKSTIPAMRWCVSFGHSVRKPMKTAIFMMITSVLLGTLCLAQNTASPSTYQPKFKGDPARSDSEAVALGYIRTVLYAEREYKKKHGTYATSLAALVHSGSFTKRMVSTERGDYKVAFHGDGKGFTIRMTPNEITPERRAFFADETGVIRADEQKPADKQSPPVTGKGAR